VASTNVTPKGKKRELFAWAHAVAQRHTGKAEAWYAVGCYYLVTGKLESARTYLSKATTLALPAEAGPAWYLPIVRRPSHSFIFSSTAGLVGLG
jgi:hypothetical protein